MTVTPRRERREKVLRRRQRENRGGHSQRGGSGGGRGWLIGIGVIVLFVAALFGLNRMGVLTTGPVAAAPTPLQTVGIVDPNDKARGVKEDEDPHSAGHVSAGTPGQYTSLPPTSGVHWPAPTAPLKAGVYDALQPFEATTHNLEHGGIVIVYNGLSVGEADQLKQFVKDTISKTKYAKVLVMPYPALQGAKVTATAWRWRLNLDSADTASLLKFIGVHYDSSDAPEPGAGW